jgi:autotransporter translocation and assembly factor TamB
MIRALPLLCAVVLTACAWADEKPAKSVAGYWLGTLKVGAIELRLGLHIEKKSDGTLTATLDSIDQGVTGLKAETVTLTDGTLTVKMRDSSYSGTLQPDGDTIKGHLEQLKTQVPLDLKRQAGPFTLNRPQTPKKPYPYESEDLTFPSRAKDVTLAATYTRPKGDGPFPAVALISGSGTNP